MSEILLIDAEQPFAQTMKSALEGKGFSVKQLDDGKDGLEYARSSMPALIVLCVELPKMSGYSICNKLKKDDDLKGIPLLITSSEATPETFAQHRKLKTRAEDYLIKPFDAPTLIEKIGELIPLPSGGAAAGAESLVEEESLSLDSFDALDALEEKPAEESLSASDFDDIKLPADDAGGGDLNLDDLGSLDDLGGDLGTAAAQAEESLQGLDDLGGDLSFDQLEADSGAAPPSDAVGDDALLALDSAFDGMGTGGEATDPEADKPPPLPASLSTATPTFTAPPTPSSMPAVSTTSAADLEALSTARRENTDLRAKVSELEARVRSAEESARSANALLNDKSSSSSSSARETLELKKEVRAKEKELMDLKDELLKKDEVVVELEERVAEVQREAQVSLDGAAKKDAEIASLNARVKAVSDERDALERSVRERTAKAEQDMHEAQARVQQAEGAAAAAKGDAERLAGELERVKKELEKSQNEANRALADVSRARSELDDQRARVTVVEKDAKETKDQLVDAYNRIKGEERVREKAKRAVEIALTLLQGDVDAGGGEEGLSLAELDA